MTNFPKFLILVASFCCLLLLSISSRGQGTITVKGKVIDSKDGNPLAGVTVQQVNGNQSAVRMKTEILQSTFL